MLFRIKFLAMFAILLALPGIGDHGRSSAQDSPSWQEQFLAEAPTAWEKYRTRAKRFQGTFERTTVRLAPKREVMERNRFEMKQRDGCALFLAQGLGSGSPPDNVGLVLGINRQYGFELRRMTHTAPWTLAQLDVDLRDGMKFGSGTHPSEGVVYWSTCPTTFALPPHCSGVSIRDPEFTLKRVTPVTRNDRQVIKVEFAYRPLSDKSKIPSFEGWVLYDPQRYWVIHEYHIDLEWASLEVKSSDVVVYEYEEASDGFPIPKQIIYRVTPVGGVDRESRYEFDLKEADVPESEFTLSAFGLSEPPGLAWKRPIRWYLWVGLAGIVCLILGVGFRRLRRRKAGSA